MKTISILLYFIPSLVLADDVSTQFYEPSALNAYQGKLFYDPSTQDYPIGKMRELCKAYTGVDTAQTKCQSNTEKKITICEYKCSMHWSVKK